MILLTDEEIRLIEEQWSSRDDEQVNLTDVAKAQLKKVAEWLGEKPGCKSHHWFSNEEYVYFELKMSEWRALLEETK